MSKEMTIEDAIKECLKLYEQKNYQKCFEIADKIPKTHIHYIDGRYVSALCHIDLASYEPAKKLLQECLSKIPDSAEVLFRLGYIYSMEKNIPSAIECYEKALSSNPKHVGVLNNLANIYNDISKSDRAIKLLETLIELGCNEYFVYNNIALIYKRVGMLDEAYATIKKAIELNPNDYRQYHNAALIASSKAQYKSALEYYKQALDLSPDNLVIASEYSDALRKVCDWETCDKVEELIKNMSTTDVLNLSPMSDIQQTMDLSSNLEAAKRLIHNQVATISKVSAPFKFNLPSESKDKLRVAYMSSDIKDHPVAHLTRGIFKHHNKEEFEIYLYSSSGEDRSGYKDEIKSYCDKFIDIRNISNQEVANRIYNDNIDILIDLNGHTGESKVDALYLKPAPIQVNYLGYIGSMGADFIDYIITDEIVTPMEHQSFYTEKFAYLPDCYQANDNELKISDEIITRDMEGLPENAFVFCSFNQTAKIEPSMFDVWMNILKRVPDSVLWIYRGSIYEHDTLAMENLQKEAKKRGVDTSRLIFADAAFIDKHLKRKSLANLALDTRFYNGGTVTSQTLWAGTPVLTLKGEHFASRMASSILTALHLPELITNSLEEYENLAVELAQNPEKLNAIKNKLDKNRLSAPLFNTEEFVKNLEKLYKLMWENYSKGNPPRQLKVN